MAKTEKRPLSPEEQRVKRKQNLYLGGALAALLTVAMVAAALTGSPQRPKAAAPETKQIALGGSSSDRDAWRANEASRIEVLEKEKKEMLLRMKAFEEEQKRARAEAQARASVGARDPSPVQPPPVVTTPSPPATAPSTRAPVTYPPPPSTPFRQVGPVPSNAGAGHVPGSVAGAGAPSVSQGPSLRVLVVAAADPSKPSPDRAYRESDSSDASAPSGSGVQSFIPSGSFAKAVLLNGVDAPTGGNAQQNPMPILLQLLDDAQLPNEFRSRLSGCFALADAHGDLSSERVLARLNRLSCVDQDGAAVDLKVTGFITDETGRVGAQGKLITKTGQVLGNAMFAGVLSGIGKGIQADATQQNTTITGAVTTQVNNPWKAGLGEGLGKSFDRIADYYLKLADKLFPVVSIDPGRTVEIVFTKGVEIQRK